LLRKIIGGGSNPRLIVKENAGCGSPCFGIEWRNRELEGGEEKKGKYEMHLFAKRSIPLFSEINLLATSININLKHHI